MQQLIVPEQFKSIYQIDLQPEPETEIDLLSDTYQLPKEFGRVKIDIGKPISWSISDFYALYDQPLPSGIRLQMQSTNFSLIRFAFSFKPDDKTIIENAEIEVQFFDTSNSDKISAIDIFPERLLAMPSTPLDVSITPDFKFSASESDLDNSKVKITYPTVHPKVYGFGLQEDAVSWEIIPIKGESIKGNQMLHVILSWPRGIEKIRAAFEINAKVKKDGFASWGFNNKASLKSFGTYIVATGFKKIGELDDFDTGRFVNEPSPVQLKAFLTKHFNRSEIREICFELDINHENLAGERVVDFIIELINFSRRRQKYFDLIQAICQKRQGLEFCP